MGEANFYYFTCLKREYGRFGKIHLVIVTVTL